MIIFSSSFCHVFVALFVAGVVMPLVAIAFFEALPLLLHLLGYETLVVL